MSKQTKANAETVETKAPETYAERITAEAIAQGLTATDAAKRIATAEDAMTSAADAYRNALTLTVYVAQTVATSERGKASDIAAGLAGTREGKAFTAAKKRVSRWVAVGKILAAHPDADALAVAAFANRATEVGIAAAVAAKGDPITAGEKAEKAAKATKRAARPNDGTDQTDEAGEESETVAPAPAPRDRVEVIADEIARAFDVFAAIAAEIEKHADTKERETLRAMYRNAIATLAKAETAAAA